MALTLSTKARNASVDARTALLDEGAAAGKLVIRASTTVLATVTLNDPAFGAAAAGSATAAGLPKTVQGTAAGAADNYQATDSDDEVMWSGTVSASGGGGDLQLDNVNIAVGQDVTITSWTHSQPA